MIVLWNTLYINAALEQLAREGHHITPEDVARSRGSDTSSGVRF
jgi:TnpA family transposase